MCFKVKVEFGGFMLISVLQLFTGYFFKSRFKIDLSFLTKLKYKYITKIEFGLYFVIIFDKKMRKGQETFTHFLMKFYFELEYL
ncbi:hypothetical protein B0A68_01625 [Flavobacterium reichenbachii]|uniref:Uncharacterized protein n=1 Tax=Flavobacterium reichenbachii TaxID=362418 RepID=A0A085ZQE2_9FLAO|nr:hypothetical protein IW19_14575 [Flavobacterium reichenbachii]OXB18740.1 hypothetical protein B0A68_01625 [Flavobacterium reichenbachii]